MPSLSKDRRHPLDALSKLSRQASAPSLAPNLGSVSLESGLRGSLGSKSFSTHGLPRSSSAVAHKNGGTNSLRSGVSVSRQRAGLEFLPHDESIGGRSTSAVGRRADAHLLESRLIEHLQGHGRSDVHRKRPAEPRRGHRRASPVKVRPSALLSPGPLCFSGRASLPTEQHSQSGLFAGRTEEETLPESRLKIYSDLFEEVIDRDRVFGSLLRKIKTAYDSVLHHSVLRSEVPFEPVPVSPMRRHSVPSGVIHPDNGRYGGVASNEPTTREGLQVWELDRENHVLKHLVERLHVELEDSVKREKRWKQKASKISRAQSASQHQCVQHESWEHPKGPWPEDGQRTVPGMRVDHDAPLYGMNALSNLSFHAQTHKSEVSSSARSTDSGMLPQRPTRRHCPKPSDVPALDFTHLKNQTEEEEEEAAAAAAAEVQEAEMREEEGSYGPHISNNSMHMASVSYDGLASDDGGGMGMYPPVHHQSSHKWASTFDSLVT